MTDPLALIAAYLDDTLSEPERTELTAWLKADPAHLRQFTEAVLLEQQIHAAVHATAERAAAADFEAPAPRSRTRWPGWRPALTAAAGIVLGMFGSSMVWAYVAPQPGKVVKTLFKESFEKQVPGTVPGLPRELGVWAGDEARVVEEEQDLVPRHRKKMLRFLSATYPGENAKQSVWSDVYRLVDLRGEVSDTNATLRLSASFSATPFADGEEYSGSLELCALENDLADLPQPLTLPWVRENGASIALRKIPLKGDRQWKRGIVEITVSPQARYVLVHLAVFRAKPYPPAEPVQFGGHYIDDLRLDLIRTLR